MDIIRLDRGTAAIFLDSRELNRLGLAPDTLEKNTAQRLVRDALGDTYLPAESPLEIEAYAGRTEVMLFARVSQDAAVLCRFASLEELSMAARALPPGIGSLCFIEDNWCLLLQGCELLFCAALWEFGDPEPLSAGYRDHLAEHGRVIFPTCATARLLEYFS